MLRFLRFPLLALELVCPVAFGQRLAAVEKDLNIAVRDIFSSIGRCSTGGAACLTSSSTLETSSSAISTTISSSASSASNSLTSSSTTSSSSSTNTGPVSYDMVITTTFTQPPECTADSMSQMVWDSQLWKNFVDPVPASTFTSCFPSQFYSSVVASAAGTTLPAFRSLVCPYNWETYNLNSTYIICCPNGFNFLTPDVTNSDRPGLGAVCTSTVGPGVLMDITSFDSSKLATIIPATAGTNGTIVLADAYDGIAASTTGPSAASSSTKSSGTTSISTLKSFSSTSTIVLTSSKTTSTSSNTMSASSSAPSASGYSYFGCYTEATNVRALSAASLVNYKTMTVEICESFCSAYTYAGLEYGGECWCGNSFGQGSVVAPEKDCSFACGGNAAETCGAGNRLSVWEKGTFWSLARIMSCNYRGYGFCTRI